MMEALRRLMTSTNIVGSAAAMAWVTVTAVLFALLMISLRAGPTDPFINQPKGDAKQVTSQFGL
jgi:hypothetical protein